MVSEEVRRDTDALLRGDEAVITREEYFEKHLRNAPPIFSFDEFFYNNKRNTESKGPGLVSRVMSKYFSKPTDGREE